MSTARSSKIFIKPSDHLAEEFPEISSYLVSLGSSTSLPPPSNRDLSATIPPNSQLPSEHATNAASEELAERLMASVRELAMASSSDGEEPTEEEIRRAVESVVLQGVNVGREMGQNAAAASGGAGNGPGHLPQRDAGTDSESKRSRTE